MTAQATILLNKFEKHTLEITGTFPWGQWVNRAWVEEFMVWQAIPSFPKSPPHQLYPSLHMYTPGAHHNIKIPS